MISMRPPQRGVRVLGEAQRPQVGARPVDERLHDLVVELREARGERLVRGRAARERGLDECQEIGRDRPEVGRVVERVGDAPVPVGRALLDQRRAAEVRHVDGRARTVGRDGPGRDLRAGAPLDHSTPAVPRGNVPPPGSDTVNVAGDEKASPEGCRSAAPNTDVPSRSRPVGSAGVTVIAVGVANAPPGTNSE